MRLMLSYLPSAVIICSVVRLEKGHGRQAAKLIAALEEGNLENEEIAHKVASELFHERASSLGRST